MRMHSSYAIILIILSLFIGFSYGLFFHEDKNLKDGLYIVNQVNSYKEFGNHYTAMDNKGVFVIFESERYYKAGDTLMLGKVKDFKLK